MIRIRLSDFVSGLVLLGFCTLVSPPLRAQQQLIDILDKGSEWTMQLDGDTATLKLLGGRGGWISSGGFELKYDVTWGGTQGELQAQSDAANRQRNVRITLALAGGARTQCAGSLALGNDNMMAGTCDSATGTGAWYAVRAGGKPAGGTRPGANKPAALGEKPDKVAPDIAAGRHCPPGQGVQPPPLSDIEGRATGVYEVGDKSDSTIKLDFPTVPGSSSTLGKWLDAHNEGLLSALRSLYSSPDINQVLGAERSQCSEGGIFCQMGYRQQVLSAALAGSR